MTGDAATLRCHVLVPRVAVWASFGLAESGNRKLTVRAAATPPADLFTLSAARGEAGPSLISQKATSGARGGQRAAAPHS